MSEMRRREFITLLGGMATAWPFAARAQQPTTMPVIGLINAGIRESAAYRMTDFRHGLNEAGYVEGQSVTIEYRWAEGRYDLMPELVADLLNRQVAIIATPDSTAAALAAKAATASVPIVFGDGEDPIKLGLVSSLAQPGGNVTGAAAPATELEGKRLRLLRELVPAGSIGVLVNPASPASDAYWKDIQEASRAVRQEINILHASNEHEIDFAFTIAATRRPGALIVAPDAFFDSRHKLLVRRAETHAIPAIYRNREFVAAGGLMSYGTRFADQYRQTGIYAGRILNGEKPADLPVVQATNVELVINLKTAKALGLEIPRSVLDRADEVIE
jgi:putative tryptophan/tyrosine transport system substrate-binding protein